MSPAEPAELEDLLELAASLLAAAIFVVSVLAWRRRPVRRTALLAVGFGLLTVRGVLLALGDFVVGEEVGDVLGGLAVPLEIGFLLLVAIAFLRA